MIQTSRSEISVRYFLDTPPPIWVPPKERNVINFLIPGFRASLLHKKKDQNKYSNQNNSYMRSSVVHELRDFHQNNGNYHEAAADDGQLTIEDIRNQTNSDLSIASHDNIDVAKTGYLTYDNGEKNEDDDAYYSVLNRQLSVSPHLSANKTVSRRSSSTNKKKSGKMLSQITTL